MFEAKMITLPVGVLNACKCNTYNNYKDQEIEGLTQLQVFYILHEMIQ